MIETNRSNKFPKKSNTFCKQLDFYLVPNELNVVLMLMLCCVCKFLDKQTVNELLFVKYMKCNWWVINLWGGLENANLSVVVFRILLKF